MWVNTDNLFIIKYLFHPPLLLLYCFLFHCSQPKPVNHHQPTSFTFIPHTKDLKRPLQFCSLHFFLSLLEHSFVVIYFKLEKGSCCHPHDQRSKRGKAEREAWSFTHNQVKSDERGEWEEFVKLILHFIWWLDLAVENWPVKKSKWISGTEWNDNNTRTL